MLPIQVKHVNPTPSTMSIPRASVGDYTRNNSIRGDSEYLRNENKHLQLDLDKFKAQCGRLNEEIENLQERLAGADRKIARLTQEKEEFSRSE